MKNHFRLATIAAVLLFAAMSSLSQNTIATPWTGKPGVTVSVKEIMKAQNAPSRTVASELRNRRKEFEIEQDNLPQNPLSPEVSSWPPRQIDKRNKEVSDILSPQTIGTAFNAVTLSESGAVPPDVMGDVGPTQILVHVNGRIKVFDKNGTLGSLNADDNVFWTSVRSQRDSCFVSDPHVRYDPITKRWFLCIIDIPDGLGSEHNHILIAVSSDSIITSSSSFTFFGFYQDSPTPTGSDAGQFADYPTLGVDANALYIGTNIFNATTGSFIGSSVFVVNKAALLTGTLTVSAFREVCTTASGSGPYTPQGVQNDDPSATEGYFIGSDVTTNGVLKIRRISNPGGTPSISSNISLTVPTTYSPADVSAKGSSLPLDGLDRRLFAAAMHKNKKTGVTSLVTAHTIRVTSAGVGGSSGTRNGSRWYEIRNMTSTPTLYQSGTVYSSASSSAPDYWIPSIAMSGQGHMAIGCSFAGSADYTSIGVAGRYFGDVLGTTQSLTTAIASTVGYNAETGSRGETYQRWGDYTQTVVDPTDDMTMWTFQEYGNGSTSWAVRAIKLNAPPPATPVSASPSSVNTNATTNVTITGTSTSGSQFFDPGSGYSKRISATVNGGGVTVNSVTWVDSVTATLNITIANNATSGTRTVTITNPDGQTATSATGIITVNGITCPTITLSPSTLPNGAAGVAYNQSITASGGTAAYSYALTSGSLPSGLSLSSAGVLSGTSTFGTSASFTVTATDANGCTGSQAYSLTITGCPQITLSPSTLPSVTQGASYTQTVTASGGTAAYTYAVTAGSLPAGLTLSTGGAITGTASTTGTSSFTITATDANSCTGSKAYSITVNTCPTITLSPSTLAAGTVSSSYSQTITSSGGTAAYSYAVTTGSLPAGLSLSSGGALTGTPTTAGSSNFTVTSTDANGCTGTQAYTLTVNAGGSSSSTSLTAGGVAYTQDFNTLATTGTSSTVPAGWALLETGTSANVDQKYSAGTGSSSSGDLYSFGSASASDRALGGLRSGTLTPTFGVAFTNNTGGTITSLLISYTGEEWRMGATGRVDSLLFALSTNATSLSTGTWVKYSTLNFGSPVTAGTAGPLDGNANANRTAVSATISGLSIANGSTFWIRWSDYDYPSGAEDGLAVDDFSLTPTVSAGCPTITLSPSTLPNGTNGTAYSQTITASGGTGSYSYAVTSGALPTGLSLSSGGAITGTPTANSTYNFTVTATDANSCTGSQAYSVTVSGGCPTITLSPSTLPNGTNGTAYNQSVTASGGTASYTYGVTTGTLPTGLSLSSGGVLSGTPTANGNYSFTISATDANSCVGSQSYSVTISPASCPTITLSPSTLPNGTNGTAYNQTISASGGTAAYTYAVTAGSVPAGLTLSTGGSLSGTPTASGSASFTVTATDANGCTGAQAYTLTVDPAAGGSSISLTALNSAYTQDFNTLAATDTSNTVVPQGWGFVEAGSKANSFYWADSGNTTSGNTYSYGWTAGDRAFGTLGSNSLQSTIGAAFTNNTGSTIASLTIAYKGEQYRLGATGRSDTLRFAYSTDATSLSTGTWTGAAALDLTSPVTTGTVGLLNGNLPANQKAVSSTISGLSIANGATFYIRFADVNIVGADDGLAIDDFSLTPAGAVVCPTITVAPSTLPDVTVGVAYSQSVTASGGKSPYTYAVSAGTLLPGLSLAANGQLSGTVLAAASSSFTVTATDSNGCTGSTAYTVNATCPSISITPSTVPGGTVGDTYSQALTANGGSSPYRFALASGSLPTGVTLGLRGGLTGTLQDTGTFNFNVTVTDTNGCTGNGSYAITVAKAPDTLIAVDVAIDARWNMVSNPVTGVSDTVGSLFPAASSSAYWYGFSGYAQAQTMSNGLGYWLKYASAHTVTIHGYALTAETLHVYTGWNMIGTLSAEVPASALTLQTSIISSPVFGYSNGYTQATALVPGKGYWVKASHDGDIVLSGAGAAAKSVPMRRNSANSPVVKSTGAKAIPGTNSNE